MLTPGRTAQIRQVWILVGATVAAWSQHVPGFRSGTRWRRIAASIGYFVVLVLTIWGSMSAGIIALVALLLNVNRAGLCSHPDPDGIGCE